MKKRMIGCIGTFVCLLVLGISIGSAEGKAMTWNKKKTYTATKGAFKFYAHLSKDKKKSWVYMVKPKKKKASPAKLDFPKKIKKASVIRIGADMSIMGDSDTEFYKNVFNEWVEHAHEVDGSCRGNKKIKTMLLPSTVAEIDATSFSGMRQLTKVKIPDKVRTLYAETFYGCKKLKEVKLPKNLSAFSPYTCFDDCPKLDKVTLSKKNKKYIIKNDVLLTKDGKNLIWAIPKKKTIIVPDTVQTIASGAFYDSQVRKIQLGKNVAKLEEDSMSGTEIETITVDAANPIYAKDGQCIYRKEDGTLAVAVAKQAELVISNKVKRLTSDATLCGTLSEDRELYLLDIPASVISLGQDWIFTLRVSTLGKVYYRGATPPQLEKPSDESSASLPIFCDIYVPKASLSLYQNWYKSVGDFEFIEKDEWHTF